MTLREKILAKLAFDGDGYYSKINWSKAFRNGAKEEHARLAPLHQALLRVVEAAEDVLQTKSAGGPIAHADWMSLEQSLADIARVLEE